jgi:hypothetical protein
MLKASGRRDQSITTLTGCGQSRRDAKQIYPNRISFKELFDMLHDESSKFKAQRTEGRKQEAEGSQKFRLGLTAFCLMPAAFCFFSLLSCG